MNEADIYKALAAPFPLDDLEWRVQISGKNKSKPGDDAMMLPYVTARAVAERFSLVLGVGHWRSSSRKETDGWICKIEVLIDGVWVWHEDGSPETDIEAFKGGLSKALVRCAVRFGVGAYLYGFPFQWVKLEGTGDRGYPPRNWKPDISKIPADCRPSKTGRPATDAPVARVVDEQPPEDPKRPANARGNDPQPVGQIVQDMGVLSPKTIEARKQLEQAFKLIPVSAEVMRAVFERVVDTAKAKETNMRYLDMALAAVLPNGKREESPIWSKLVWIVQRKDIKRDEQGNVEAGRAWRDWISGPLYQNASIVYAWAEQVRERMAHLAKVDDDFESQGPTDAEMAELYGSQGREP